MPTNIFRWELLRDRTEAKSFVGVVLVQVRTVHYLAQTGNETLSHLSCKQRASPEWFHCFFRSNTLWFTVATYLAYTRLRTKSNASSQGSGKKIMMPNVAFIANEDREKAEEWLQSYHNFMRHASEELIEKMTAR